MAGGGKAGGIGAEARQQRHKPSTQEKIMIDKLELSW
jgi:hypothetical protein